MNKEVTSKNAQFYSAAELEKLHIPGLTIGERAIRDRAEREGWPFITVPSRGKYGETKKFSPPESLLLAIEQRQRGEIPAAYPTVAQSQQQSQSQESPGGVQFQRAMEPAPRAEPRNASIDGSLLKACLSACVLAYGEAFQRENTALQMEYATDFYNQLVKIAAGRGDQGSALAAFGALDIGPLADQLRILVKLGWARSYEAPRPGTESWTW